MRELWAGVVRSLPLNAIVPDALVSPLLSTGSREEVTWAKLTCVLSTAFSWENCASLVRECRALSLAASLCRAVRGRIQELVEEEEHNWEPRAAGGLHVRLILGVFLNRGLDPQAKPGLLWSLHVCHAVPHGQSHLAAEDERMQHGHFDCVQATPFTKVDLAASLSFLHVARGQCSMKEVGVGDRGPVPVCAQVFQPEQWQE